MTVNSLHVRFPLPANEPLNSYAPGTQPRVALKEELKRQSEQTIEIPLIINGKEVKTGNIGEIRAPHNHNLLLAKYHMPGPAEVKMAIDGCLAAAESWRSLPWEERAAIFQRAAELLAGPYRMVLNAATMLGQSKTAHQAEIDSAAELIDFLRFNLHFWDRIYSDQPPVCRTPDAFNRLEYRPLEGFIFAISPFNFTAIGGNLPTSPVMGGNVAIWKPASTAVLSNYYFMKLLLEAGLPAGVINFLPGKGSVIGNPIFDHPDFAGLHFTGSTDTFNGMWKRVAENLEKGLYRNYPRMVGETGGKNFVLACPDSDVDALATALVRGAFEYQGQKCSAASRAYIPASIWPAVNQKMADMLKRIKVGDVADFSNFLGAVIDKASFQNIVNYIEFAKKADDAEIIHGGKYDDSKGWFIDPTVVKTTNPKFKLMTEEIFGPVLTVYVYEDNKLEETIKLVDETSPYALTGALFSRNRDNIFKITEKLRYAAGNYYINDKPTGAVVGQQPFGGGRASGTNDKAGSHLNLLRWVSPRNIKETLISPTSFEYPFMQEP
ncbi:MAG: L-glutamate gamma-semialdehyde dehydrogenase [Candidatus Rifleibacteriota bacterium]